MSEGYIIDNLGNYYDLVQFFDHDSQEYLFALRLVQEPKS